MSPARARANPVVGIELLAQVAGLDANHRIHSLVVVAGAVEDGQPHAVLLEIGSPAGERFFDQEAQQHGEPRGPALQVTLDIVDQVIPVEKADVVRAAEIVGNRTSMSARNALHISIMERHGIRSIVSFDADFDGWPGLNRIHGV